MVEARYERSPSYFKQFQKQFIFKIVDQKPTDITNLINYAVCPHFESEFCQIATNHFHLLIDSSTDIGSPKQNKSFAVPRLFTTFKHLFSNSSKLETNGDVFTKLQLAVDLNDKTGEKVDLATVHKRLPISNTAKMLTTTKTMATKTTGIAQKTIHNTISIATGHEPTQTEQICTETLKLQNIFSGPHSGAFCKDMDIFVSGYGNIVMEIDIDFELLFVRLVFEEKIKFRKKYFNQQILKHHVKCEAKQLNIINFYNLSFTEYNMRNINTKKSTQF